METPREPQSGEATAPPPAQQPTRSAGPLGSFLREMSEAVRQEIAAAKRDPQRLIPLYDGEPVWEKDEGTLVRFRCEASVNLAPETPIVLQRDDEPEVGGTLVAVDDFDVFLFLRTSVAEQISNARIASEPWFIQEALVENLGELLETPQGDDAVPLAILGEASAKTGRDAKAAAEAVAALQRLTDERLHPNEAQQAALERILGSRLHYVWGPPGTGKTACLAQAARAVVLRGDRLLVLAHANVAVDVAVLRIADAFAGTRELRAGQILRVGVPQLADVWQRGPITPDGALQLQQPALIARRDALEGERRDLVREMKRGGGDGARLEEVRGELALVRKRIDEELDRLVDNARVLVTTLSRSAIDSRVRRWPADTLFVDEASMAPFPFVIAAAVQPQRRHCAVFGDFRQLPPVVVAKTKPVATWLGRDAFQIGGVTDRIDSGQGDTRVTMLDLQYRMAEPIADVVSRLSYLGRLRTAPGAGRPRGGIPFADPWPDAGIVFADSSLLGGPCVVDPKAGSWSRANPLHALLSLEIAARFHAGGTGDIALTTPYRLQARLLDILLGERGDEAGPRGATIHRLQGSECDVVVVDVTDAPPLKGPSQLTDGNADLARRLFNVAISRARTKLVVVAAAEFLTRSARANGPLRQTLDLLRQRGHLWRPAPDDLAAGSSTGFVEWLGAWDSAAPRLANELTATGEGLVVNWPAAMPLVPEVTEALRRAARRSARPARLYVPPLLAQQLEETAADLRLMTKAAGFFVRLAADRLLLGGSEREHAFAMVRGERQVEALLSVLDPDPSGPAMLSAAAQHELDRLCGRCASCGEYRRPRKAGDGAWVLRCGVAQHESGELGPSGVHELLRAVDLRCGECGEPLSPRARKGGGPLLSCGGRSRGCRRNAVRDLSRLFGGN